MKLKLVKRKKMVSESTDGSLLTISMSPSDYVKLITYGETFTIISNFILGGKHKEAIQFDSSTERTKFILKSEQLSEIMSEQQELAVGLLLGGLNFLQPTTDKSSWGKFDPEKTGTTSLEIELQGEIGKVIDHEGRNRNVYLWMKGERETNVTVSFTNSNIETLSEFPQTLIPQYESKYKVFKQNIKPQKENGNTFSKVEGFMNFWNDKKFNKGSMGLDDFINKFNNEHSIKVNGEEAIVIKTKGLNPPGSEYDFNGVYEFNLYPKTALSVKKTGKEVDYFRELEKLKFKLTDGPVTIK